MKTYEVDINGISHTLQLSDEDAKRYGKAAVEVKAAVPKNKAAQPSSNK